MIAIAGPSRSRKYANRDAKIAFAVRREGSRRRRRAAGSRPPRHQRTPPPAATPTGHDQAPRPPTPPPHLHQQQPLPRIHHLRLTRRDLKEQRIELRHPRQPPHPIRRTGGAPVRPPTTAGGPRGSRRRHTGPSAKTDHNCCTDRAPGNRPLIPTIATGSSTLMTATPPDQPTGPCRSGRCAGRGHPPTRGVAVDGPSSDPARYNAVHAPHACADPAGVPANRTERRVAEQRVRGEPQLQAGSPSSVANADQVERVEPVARAGSRRTVQACRSPIFRTT